MLDRSPIRTHWFSWLLWLGILCLGLVLRLQNLSGPPLHADEATGARILADRLEAKGYAFDPRHFHGPLLSLSAMPLARLRGEATWASLDKWTLRIGPALAGALTLLTPLFWRRHLGQWGSLAAGALLATSPLLVYYNRIYIHESLLALLAMLALAGLFRFLQRADHRSGALTGLCLGLMFATKETAAISVLAWVPAVAACMLWQRVRPLSTEIPHTLPSLRDYVAGSLSLVLSALFIAALLYSQGFTRMAGLSDAVRTFFLYETTPGHDKAATYYLKLLLWPKFALGHWWTEAVICLLALIACIAARYDRLRSTPVLFLAIVTVLHFIIYSAIAYKTPWLSLVPWTHACLLAGFAFADFQDFKKPALRIGLLLLLIAGLAYQTRQSLQATGRLANDARNPYAYVPTSKDVENLESWFHALMETQPLLKSQPSAVLGSGYWPLPWYLRDFPSVAYWPRPVPGLRDHPLVIVMPEQFEAAKALLGESHTGVPRGLRANVAVMVYLRNDLWEDWLEQ